MEINEQSDVYYYYHVWYYVPNVAEGDLTFHTLDRVLTEKGVERIRSALVERRPEFKNHAHAIIFRSINFLGAGLIEEYENDDK